MNKATTGYCPVHKKLFVQIKTPERTGLIAYLTPEEFDKAIEDAQKWSTFLKEEKAKEQLAKRNEAIRVLQEN